MDFNSITLPRLVCLVVYDSLSRHNSLEIAASFRPIAAAVPDKGKPVSILFDAQKPVYSATKSAGKPVHGS